MPNYYRSLNLNPNPNDSRQINRDLNQTLNRSNNRYRLTFCFQILIFLFCFISLRVKAHEVFIEPLCWQATESIDWVLSNNLNAQNQNITYSTISFDNKIGYRAGIQFSDVWDEWNTRLAFTRYYTTTRSSTTGNLVSTFLGGKLAAQGNFFTSGQVFFKIDFNMLDWDIYKPVYAAENVCLSPILGLRGGSINQNAITYFQGSISLTENVTNNFRGLGPKMGIEGKWIFYRINQYQLSLFSNFSTSYLWGQWIIKDATFTNGSTNYYINNNPRKLGAFAIQGIVGIKLDHECWTMNLGYEIADWFNQYQVLDDGTGGHSNDLILQGVTLGISYRF